MATDVDEEVVVIHCRDSHAIRFSRGRSWVDSYRNWPAAMDHLQNHENERCSFIHARFAIFIFGCIGRVCLVDPCNRLVDAQTDQHDS